VTADVNVPGFAEECCAIAASQYYAARATSPLPKMSEEDRAILEGLT
jgi:hypothetical protein